MWINVIDYRGEPGLSYEQRSHHFLKQQQDFTYWQQHGHKFCCFTQHDDDQYPHFDKVVKIPRGTAAESRNHVLEHYAENQWIGIWDNDATVYWDKLKSQHAPSEFDQIISLADSLKLQAFVPFNPSQTPYTACPDHWSFRATTVLKGTMMFIKTSTVRFDTALSALEDTDYALQLTALGHRVGRLEQLSLKEYAANNSTIFNKHNRKEIYAKNKQLILDKYGKLFLESRLGVDGKFIFKRMGELQRSYWNGTRLKSLDPLGSNLFVS